MIHQAGYALKTLSLEGSVIEPYYEIKDPVLDIIMEGANDWAQNTNWLEPPDDSSPI
jgi:hypothetical protein